MPDRTPARRLLLDIRVVVIGGLFCGYGLIVGAAGLFAAPADIAKATGVNINLWTGLALLVAGSVFLLWASLRPLPRGMPGS